MKYVYQYDCKWLYELYRPKQWVIIFLLFLTQQRVKNSIYLLRFYKIKNGWSYKLFDQLVDKHWLNYFHWCCIFSRTSKNITFKFHLSRWCFSLSACNSKLQPVVQPEVFKFLDKIPSVWKTKTLDKTRDVTRLNCSRDLLL